MVLIGLTGQMGVGKSTVVKCISELNPGKRVVVLKFAQPLYDIQEFVYNRIKSVYKRPETFTKDRLLLQWLGTEWGRNTISSTLWADLWVDELNYIRENYPNTIVICDDVRFDNEAELICNQNGFVIKIESTKNSDRITIKEGQLKHASEAGVNPNNIYNVLHNNGTIQDLKSSLLLLNEKTRWW